MMVGSSNRDLNKKPKDLDELPMVSQKDREGISDAKGRSNVRLQKLKQAVIALTKKRDSGAKYLAALLERYQLRDALVVAGDGDSKEVLAQMTPPGHIVMGPEREQHYTLRETDPLLPMM
ncbi:hypothetical protein FRB94_012553 [Tulasnella sp. JGI-2019a]|nr:hypothetical protein FRB94_012553 [Tulasnella sp. JGI-2019a]KAG9003791.1 hypothetical protein FRB93_010807 [Tulasnella sp. JGI-2019a]